MGKGKRVYFLLYFSYCSVLTVLEYQMPKTHDPELNFSGKHLPSKDSTVLNFFLTFTKGLSRSKPSLRGSSLVTSPRYQNLSASSPSSSPGFLQLHVPASTPIHRSLSRSIAFTRYIFPKPNIPLGYKEDPCCVVSCILYETCHLPTFKSSMS